MITALLEVHNDVQQRNLVSTTPSVQSIKIAGQDELVIFPGSTDERFRNSVSCKLLLSPFLITYSLLHGAELDSDDELCFGRHVLEHVSFESPEHVWSEHVVKFLIWSSLAMSANSSKKPSRLLQNERERVSCLQTPRGHQMVLKGFI